MKLFHKFKSKLESIGVPLPMKAQFAPMRIEMRAGRALLMILIVGISGAAWMRQRLRTMPPTPNTLTRLRAHTPSGMVLVPGGDCLLGSDDPDADDEVKPLRRVF